MAAAVLFVFSLYLLSALGHPFGQFTDDPLYVLLARSIRSGAYVDFLGRPVTDPLPGYPLLVALPAYLLSSHWGWFWIIGLVPALLAIFLTWLLARKLLSSSAAWAAAIFAALNPIMLSYAGALLPDTAYLAVSLALFCGLADSSAKNVPWWGILGALAVLMKLHGILLNACLTILVLMRHGKKKALVFAVIALLPAGIWLSRNFLEAGVLTGYATNWHAQAGLPKDYGNPLVHLARLTAILWGAGLWDIFKRMPLSFFFVMGLAMMAAFAVGAKRLMKEERQRALAFSLSLYVVLIMVLHAFWQDMVLRYIIPLAPIIWIFVVAAGQEATKSKADKAVYIAGALILVLFGAADWRVAASGLHRQPIIHPQTLEWIRTRTPPSARFVSESPFFTALVAQRFGLIPIASRRDDWIFELMKDRLDYIELAYFNPDGFFPENMVSQYKHMWNWVEQSPCFKKAYENRVEGERIYEFHCPHPERFLEAYQNYQEAGMEANSPDSKRRQGLVREKLKRAVRLEPSLAYAWAMLSTMETDPKRRIFDLQKAALADPSAEDISQALNALK